VAVKSGYGGETMEKELYLTPEITSEDVAPGALAQEGSQEIPPPTG
jgi:hypothetical protein